MWIELINKSNLFKFLENVYFVGINDLIINYLNDLCLSNLFLSRRKRRASVISKGIKKGETKLLDIGCGGGFLSNFLIKKGIQITCLPGPTALIPALVLSGLPSDAFIFEGFLPGRWALPNTFLRGF